MGKRFRDIDLIFSVSTPPTQGALAGKLKKKLGCSFVYSLQDIFPDSLVNAGFFRKGTLLWRIGQRVEDYTYRSADRIVVISESMKRNILNKSVSEDKVGVVYNWADTEAIQHVLREKNVLFDECRIDRNQFIVIYAGNFGASQNIGIILETAEILSCYLEIEFVIFGAGQQFVEFCEKAKINKVRNIKTFSLLPQERVAEVYSLGNVALITCAPGIGDSGLPSKTWSIMAAGTPIVASFDVPSEFSNMIAKARAGITVKSGDAGKLANAILQLYHSQEQLSKMGRAGRRYAENFASKEYATQCYLNFFRKALNGKAI